MGSKYEIKLRRIQNELNVISSLLKCNYAFNWIQGNQILILVNSRGIINESEVNSSLLKENYIYNRYEGDQLLNLVNLK